jgi:LAS superfamily LD-carboxypeptidase LdcB
VTVAAAVVVVAMVALAPGATAQGGGSSSSRSGSAPTTTVKPATSSKSSGSSTSGSSKSGASTTSSSGSTKSSTSSSSKSSSSKSSSKSGSSQSGSSKKSKSVDVLKASRSKVDKTVGTLAAQVAEQQRVADTKKAAADAAAAAATAAAAKVEAANAAVEKTEALVRKYAVSAFVRPPASNDLAVLALREADQASYANQMLKTLADDRARVVFDLQRQMKTAAAERSNADAASATAQSEADAAQAELDRLNGLRTDQDALARSLDQRLDRALAEAAAVKQVDGAAGDALEASEVALRASGPASPPSDGTAKPAKSKSPATTPTTAKPTPTTTAQPAPATTAKPAPAPAAAPASNIVQWTDVTRVNGIWVKKSIAGRVQSLVNAAAAAGFTLTGGGYRDPNEQIRFRTANCGPTYYDIYQKPASKCIPPTSPPGLSMHEQGLAIDFISNGSIISKRTNPAYVWLSKNAAQYGLYNLPSEPWHWSTNGK